jgi:hypothetical protein
MSRLFICDIRRFGSDPKLMGIENLRIRCDAFSKKHTAADHTVLSDDGVAPRMVVRA